MSKKNGSRKELRATFEILAGALGGAVVSNYALKQMHAVGTDPGSSIGTRRTISPETVAPVVAGVAVMAISAMKKKASLIGVGVGFGLLAGAAVYHEEVAAYSDGFAYALRPRAESLQQSSGSGSGPSSVQNQPSGFGGSQTMI